MPPIFISSSQPALSIVITQFAGPINDKDNLISLRNRQIRGSQHNSTKNIESTSKIQGFHQSTPTSKEHGGDIVQRKECPKLAMLNNDLTYDLEIKNRKQILSQNNTQQKHSSQSNMLFYGLPTTANFEYGHLQLSPKPARKIKQKSYLNKVIKRPDSDIGLSTARDSISKKLQFQDHQLEYSAKRTKQSITKQSEINGCMSTKTSQNSKILNRYIQENQKSRLVQEYFSNFEKLPLKIHASNIFQNQYVKSVLKINQDSVDK
eukprot:403376988